MIAGCAIGLAQFSVKYDSEVQPKDNIQYFTPAGNNLFVGDCIPFYKDGVFICIGCLMKDIIQP